MPKSTEHEVGPYKITNHTGRTLPDGSKDIPWPGYSGSAYIRHPDQWTTPHPCVRVIGLQHEHRSLVFQHRGIIVVKTHAGNHWNGTGEPWRYEPARYAVVNTIDPIARWEGVHRRPNAPDSYSWKLLLTAVPSRRAKSFMREVKLWIQKHANALLAGEEVSFD
jgi:hypothetical protein